MVEEALRLTALLSRTEGAAVIILAVDTVVRMVDMANNPEALRLMAMLSRTEGAAAIQLVVDTVVHMEDMVSNPEVLLFRQTKDRLIAEAKEPLIIENKELGYTIRFYLEAFELLNNGDLSYKGNTYFEPMTGSAEEELAYQKKRREIYKKSSRSFFSDLVHRQLDTTTYIMGFSQLNHDQNFVNFDQVSPSSLIFQSHAEETAYEIIIRGFLTVINQDIYVEEGANAPAPSKAELNYTKAQFSAKGPVHATSYLRSKTNKIRVNKFGKILNPSDIEEYGFWTSLRVSALLPSDYTPE